MNRGFGFLLAVPIFIIGLLTLTTVRYVYEEQEAFEEYCLAYAVDYAVDAATEELLGASHLGLDYQDWGRVRVNPERALEVFQNIMLNTYGFPMTDKAKEDLSINHLPIFCVAAYDGYYVYEQHKDNDGLWYLDSTPKIPYTYQKNGAYYSLNLGLTNCRKLVDGKLTLAQLVDEGISKETVLYQINSQVSDDLMSRYQDYERTHTGEHRLAGAMFYIPQGLTTMTQVNAIEGPSVIALVDNWDIGTIHELSSFSIGGARIEPTRQVACYTYASAPGATPDTTKWYCYVDLLPAGVDTIVVDTVVPSTKQAAELGYHYDYRLMG